MALANVAWILASNGRSVLTIDWDLEAPGLHRYFYPFLIDKELRTSDGVIDFVINLETEALARTEKGASFDAKWYKPYANILRYAASLRTDFAPGGYIDFIPAGRQGTSYPSRVTSFNWQNFYTRLGGGTFLEEAKERMREYDYVLIDSRTGVSDAAGICTAQMPDTLVVCFTLNHQSIEGAADVASSIYEQRRKFEPGIQVFPVPMRIDGSEKVKLTRMKEFAKQSFDLFPAHIPHDARSAYWGNVEVPYIPYYAFEELLAPFNDQRGEVLSLLASLERLTAYLTEDDPKGAITQVVPPDKEEQPKVIATYARLAFEEDPVLKQLKDAEEAVLAAADNVFLSFLPEQQIVAKRVFTRLVRLSPPAEVSSDKRLRVPAAEFSAAARPIIEELKHNRLVLIGVDPETSAETVELAHDGLVQKWKRMRGWLAQDREFLLWRQQLQDSAHKWQKGGHDSDSLLIGSSLAEALQKLGDHADELNDLERAFIQKSIEANQVRQQAEQEREQRDTEVKAEASKLRRRQKFFWRAIAAALCGLLIITLAGTYALVFHREKTLMKLGIWPSPALVRIDENFLMNATGAPDPNLWDYRTDQWTIVRGEGLDPTDGALLVKGATMGVLRNPYYDYRAEFKVEIKGSKANWILRSQADRQSGYLFELEKRDDKLLLNGWVYSQSQRGAKLSAGDGSLPLRCCANGDQLRIAVEVERYDFRYFVVLENTSANPGIALEDLGKELKVEMHDPNSTFRWGSIGFLETEANSQMVVQFLRVVPKNVEDK